MTTLKGFYSKILRWTVGHKIVSVAVGILVLGGGYYIYSRSVSTNNTTHYVLSAVSKGTLITSVSGTGQISAVNQLDLKPKVSANVVLVSVKAGQKVKAGQLLIELNPTDAAKSVRDAKTSLDSAQLSLTKLQEPADQLSLVQSQNALTQSEQDRETASSTLAKAYNDGFNSIASAFVDLPGLMTGLDGILNGANINTNQSNAYVYYDLVKKYLATADQFRDSALNAYASARTAYNQNLNDYQSLSRTSDRASIEKLINETYSTTQAVAEAVKNSKNYLDTVNDTLNTNQVPRIPALLATQQASLQGYTNTINSHLNDLSGILNTIQNSKNSLSTSNQNIVEKKAALAKLQAGTDPLDIQSQQISIQAKQNALRDAEDNLSYYYIRAPFDGVVATVNVKVGDPASPGSTVATVITSNQLANITLNEVDVSKIKLGNPVTLTFDALSDLTITGNVAQIDTVGTVSQGVVNYGVQISFDTQDGRVKPGMSVTGAIITNSKPNVLLAPNSAIKTQNSSRYVQVLDGLDKSNLPTGYATQGVVSKNLPREQAVQVGLSNDTMTEIVGGLSEGDLIVSKTLTSASSSGSSSAQSQTRSSGSLFGGGLLRAGGGAPPGR